MKRIIAWLVLAALVIGIPGAVINTGGTARAEEVGETGQIMADGVKVRKSPDTKSDALMELNCGEAVTVLAEDGNWYRVKFGDVLGYVRKDYVFTNSAGSRGAYAVSRYGRADGCAFAKFICCLFTCSRAGIEGKGAYRRMVLCCGG